jgi:hypothetical protein
VAGSHIHLRFQIENIEDFQFSMATAAEALAEVDHDLAIERSDPYFLFGKLIIAEIVQRVRKGNCLVFVMQPAIGLPVFAHEVMLLVPSVRVYWKKGWPIFRMPGDDRDGEDDPVIWPQELVPQ